MNTMLRRSGWVLSASSLLSIAAPASTRASGAEPSVASHARFLESFWRDAWDLDFDRDHSAAVVWVAGPASLVVALDTRGHDAYAGSATFVEDSRFAISADDDAFFVAGTFSTSRLDEPVVALIRTIVADETGTAPIVVTVFVPVAREASLGRARWWARELASVRNGHDYTAPVQPDPRCGAIHATCLTVCRLGFTGSLVNCLDDRINCVVGCLLIGTPCIFFGSPAAARICATVCIGVCAFRSATCIASAAFDYRACRLQCDQSRMTCEPGWIPPYFKF